MNLLLIFLGIVVFFIAIFTFIGNLYLLVYFSHPEDGDSKSIWFFRILVILSLTFSNYLVFLIPLDIASCNRSDSIQLGYPMSFIWTVINFSVCLTAMFILPSASAIYQCDEEETVRILKKRRNLAIFRQFGHLNPIFYFIDFTSS